MLRAAILTIGFTVVVPSIAKASTAMLAYERGGSSTPRYRMWDGSAWSTEANAQSVGSFPHWVVLRGSPITNQFALATLDNDVDVEVQIWNGSAWGTPFQATADAGDKTLRVFDMAYEQVSGELLLAYREAGTSQMRYRTYNGTTWSVEQSLSITSGNILWISLTTRPASNQILLTIMSDDSSNRARAALWNGSSFGSISSSDGWIPLHGSFEANSGDALIYYGDFSSSTPEYRTFTGTWSSPANAPNIGAVPFWGWTYSQPNTNNIFAVTIDDRRDINVTRWNGSNWSPATQMESHTASMYRRGFDIAFEPDNNQALLVYDNNSHTLRYRTWDGFSWSAELSGPSGGSAPLWTIQSVAGVVAGQIFVTYCTDAPELRTVVWNGSAFGPVTVLGATSSPKDNEMFMVAVSAGAAVPKLVNWQEVQP